MTRRLFDDDEDDETPAMAVTAIKIVRITIETTVITEKKKTSVTRIILIRAQRTF